MFNNTDCSKGMGGKVYIRTVSAQLLFSCGTFDSFLASLVRNRVYAAYVALSKRSINHFKPVLESRQQALGAFCPNIYCDEYHPAKNCFLRKILLESCFPMQYIIIQFFSCSCESESTYLTFFTRTFLRRTIFQNVLFSPYFVFHFLAISKYYF